MDSRLPVTGNHGFLPPTSSLCREDFWKADYYGKPTERLRVVSYKGPTHFWLQNMKREQELKTLGAVMTEWYDKYWETARKLTVEQVVVGGVYAAYWEKYALWLRARVLEIVSRPEGKGAQYIVQSLDYASVTAVPMDYIFPLRDLYNTFPIQAVRAELYDETKPTTPFTGADKAKFCDFVAGKDLDVMVLGEREDPKFGFPIISVMIATSPFESNEDYHTVATRLYTLDGRLNFERFFKTLFGLYES